MKVKLTSNRVLLFPVPPPAPPPRAILLPDRLPNPKTNNQFTVLALGPLVPKYLSPGDRVLISPDADHFTFPSGAKIVRHHQILAKWNTT